MIDLISRQLMIPTDMWSDRVIAGMAESSERYS